MFVYLCVQVAFKLVRILEAWKELVWLQCIFGIQELAPLRHKGCQAADALYDSTDALQLCNFLALLWWQWRISLLHQLHARQSDQCFPFKQMLPGLAR